MNLNALELEGIRAWLEDNKKNRLPLGPAVIEGNKISTVIQVTKKRSYHLHWCTVDGSKPIHARCEIFCPDFPSPNSPQKKTRSKKSSTIRIANHHMSGADPQTQSRSTKNRLEDPLQRDAWLEAKGDSPGGAENFIALEIRLLREAPSEEKRYPDKKNPGFMVYEVEMDYLPENDPDTGKPPSVIFHFDFRNDAPRKTRTRSSNARLSESTGQVIQTYDWTCTECKKCEICFGKGDEDNALLLCDNCNRGWHKNCLAPPVEKSESWQCLLCLDVLKIENETPVTSPSTSTAPTASGSAPRGHKRKRVNSDGNAESNPDVHLDSLSDSEVQIVDPSLRDQVTSLMKQNVPVFTSKFVFNLTSIRKQHAKLSRNSERKERPRTRSICKSSANSRHKTRPSRRNYPRKEVR
ncbi:hypothetical protein FB45DRAFT_897967 [Roridomyces roridus]|uniref:PHD-type domain-containing protein n=1 Tax=Roridomyces roridus TaxID=1738132 RepID=A0AAD7CC03_9AGAR|nr:hypothetical protein FB45DRAFT_897967 [Roridomyces roridus]